MSQGRPKTSSQFLLLGLLFLCAFAMTAWMFYYSYPGALSPDSLSMLKQARSGVYFDAHPPFFAMLWRPIDFFFPGSAGILLLNLGLFYGGLLFIFASLRYQYGYSTIAGLVLVGLFPPIIGILGAIWLDVVMAAFYLFGLGLLFMAQSTKEIGIKWLCILLSIIFLGYGLALRHNGAAAAIPLFSLCYLVTTNQSAVTLKKWMFSLLFGICAAMLGLVIVKNISNQIVSQKSEFWRTGAIYDLAGTSYYSHHNLLDPALFPNQTYENIQNLYVPRSLLPLMWGKQVHALPGQDSIKGEPLILAPVDNLNALLFKNWISAITQHPLSYLEHRYRVFETLVTRSPWGLWGPIYRHTEPNDLGIAPGPLRQSPIDVYLYTLTSTPLFVPAIYLVLCFLGTLISARQIINSGQLIYGACLSIFLSGLAHMAGLFFFVGSSDFRYSHWMIICAVLGAALLILALTCSYKTKPIYDNT